MPSPRQPESLRERKKAAARAAVASAAITLFIEHGYDAVSVSEICDAADVAPRSFFRYFPAKEDVLLEPIHDLTDRLRRSVASAPAGLSARETIERGLRSLAEHVLDTWNLLADYFDVLEGAASVRASPSLQLADGERALAAELARRDGARRPTWQTRLLVMRSVAAYRVWLDEIRSSDVDDPLALFDTIISTSG